MKKLIALLLALSLVFALTACQPGGGTTQEPQDEQTVEPTPDDTVETPDDSTPVEGEEAGSEETETGTEAGAESGEESGDESEEYVPDIQGSGVSESGGVSESDAWYYESVSESKAYTDDLGNEYTYSYAYPAFSDAGAEALNAKIEAFCQPFIDEMNQAAEAGYSLTTFKVSYKTGSNGPIRSILIAVECDADVRIYKTFNYNAALGAEATGAQILEIACLDEATLSTQAMSVAAEKFISLYGSISDGGFYDDQLAMTLSPDAYGKHMPLYFNDAGELCFVARIYALAGASYYDYPLVLLKS